MLCRGAARRAPRIYTAAVIIDLRGDELEMNL
jgi:hypothetical protein